MTRNQIRMVQVIVGCLAGGVTAAVTAIEGGASLGLAIALGFAAFGGTFATAALVPRTTEARDDGPKTADGKPMRYDVPLSLLALCLVPLLGACGALTQQQRDTLRRESPCIAANAALEAIPALVPFCNGKEACLTGLDAARAAARATAERECETEGDGDADIISRKDRSLPRARLGGRGPEAMRGDHHRGAWRQGSAVHVRPVHAAVRRVRRGTDAREVELAAAGVAGEERT